MAERKMKIEAWTGRVGAEDSTMIGALVIHAANGSIKQIDDSLRDALKGEPRAPVLASVLVARLRQNGYPNVHLEYPWEKEKQ